MRFLRNYLLAVDSSSRSGLNTLIAPVVLGMLATRIGLSTIALSNVLTFGPAVVAAPAQQVQIAASVYDVTVGVQNSFSLSIQSSRQVNDASILFHLLASGMNLTNPSIAQLTYRQPGTDTYVSVPLTSDGVKLNGVLRSGWTIPVGYQGTARVRVTVSSSAPKTAYFAIIEVVGTPVR